MSAPRDVNWLTNRSANRVRIADNYETMAKRVEQRLRDQNSIRREIASAKPSPKPLESPNAPNHTIGCSCQIPVVKCRKQPTKAKGAIPRQRDRLFHPRCARGPRARTG